MVFPSYNGRTACLYQDGGGGMHGRVSYQSSSALVDNEMFSLMQVLGNLIMKFGW